MPRTVFAFMRLVLTALAVIVATSAPIPFVPMPERTLEFAGRTWVVKDGHYGPGPNHFDGDNVFVDDRGRLHLRIVQRGRRWTCAEVRTTDLLGPGTYSFRVEARLDALDPWVVLGMFSYPTPDAGPDGTMEVDIEVTRWGNLVGPWLHYTAWPVRPGRSPRTTASGDALGGTHTTHVYQRLQDRVAFQSFHGHREGVEAAFAAGPVIVTDPGYVSATPMPLHLGLWLFRGHRPADVQPVEVVITDVIFAPLEAGPAEVRSVR
jgi:hypothetical protein